MKFGNVFHFSDFELFDKYTHCYTDCVLIKDFDEKYKLGVHVDKIFVRFMDGTLFMAQRDGVSWKTSNYYDL